MMRTRMMERILRLIDKAFLIMLAMIVIDIPWVVTELILYGATRPSFEDSVIGFLFALSLVQNYEDWKWRRGLK